jgi:hypothetical protein
MRRARFVSQQNKPGRKAGLSSVHMTNQINAAADRNDRRQGPQDDHG